MLASFLRCHSTTETLNLYRRGGAAYVRDKNTPARLSAKNAGGLMREGGRICRTLRYILYGCIPAVSVDEGKRECQVGVSRE